MMCDSATAMLNNDGTPNYRLLQCQKTGAIYHRDGAAAANILAGGLTLLETGRPLWGAQVLGG